MDSNLIRLARLVLDAHGRDEPTETAAAGVVLAESVLSAAPPAVASFTLDMPEADADAEAS